MGEVLHESCLKHCVPGGLVVTATSSQLASDSYGYVTGALYSLGMRLRYWFTQVSSLDGWELGMTNNIGRCFVIIGNILIKLLLIFIIMIIVSSIYHDNNL